MGSETQIDCACAAEDQQQFIRPTDHSEPRQDSRC
jgi:hypothetical protein